MTVKIFIMIYNEKLEPFITSDFIYWNITVMYLLIKKFQILVTVFIRKFLK